MTRADEKPSRARTRAMPASPRRPWTRSNGLVFTFVAAAAMLGAGLAGCKSRCNDECRGNYTYCREMCLKDLPAVNLNYCLGECRDTFNSCGRRCDREPF